MGQICIWRKNPITFEQECTRESIGHLYYIIYVQSNSILIWSVLVKSGTLSTVAIGRPCCPTCDKCTGISYTLLLLFIMSWTKGHMCTQALISPWSISHLNMVYCFHLPYQSGLHRSVQPFCESFHMWSIKKVPFNNEFDKRNIGSMKAF